ncbi:MAG TPA: hypothetical protein ENJ30_05790 [Desulfobulbaceae bacterium]|nr:hypothetical protein [Desulfobulbaceae bacterium]
MIDNYLTVRCAGFITYSDALIAKKTADNKFHAVFLSLIGTPSHIKATSAILFQGDSCHVLNQDDSRIELDFLVNPATYRTRKIGETVNKVMISSCYFEIQGKTRPRRAAVVYGQDMPTVIERAFLRLDAGTTIPLKPEWQGWLWDEVLQPEKLYSFGEEGLQEAHLVYWPDDEPLREQILEGVSLGYLT